VAKVKKRPDAIGGSSRPEFVTAHKKKCWCMPALPFLSPDPSKQNAIVWKEDSSSSSTTISNSTTSTKSNPDPVSKAASWRSTGSAPFKENSKQLFHRTSKLHTQGTRKDMVYALKSIHLDRCNSKEFQKELRNEVTILKQLDHPNIGRAIETYDYKGRLFIVLELCDGGDLYARDPYTMAAALDIVRCLCSAAAYLHSKGIIHRDIKYENVMFVDKSENADVKIIDFGLSKRFAASEHLKDCVGTVYTMSPVRSAGVIKTKKPV
jgi:hypothetical protein